MFRLIRYFSAASLVVITLTTLALVLMYRETEINHLIKLNENRNISLARVIANSMWPQYASYVTSVQGLDGFALRERQENAGIHKILKNLTRGLPVLKIKIYNLDGLTVYSSEERQIGQSRSKNKGFLKAARQGEAASKLSFRDQFAAFSGDVFNRDIVESYIPIMGRDGEVEAVFELYTDVSQLVADVFKAQRTLIFSLIVAFSSLYGLLFLIVRHANHILKSQYNEILAQSENITNKNQSLEREIFKREQAENAYRETEKQLNIQIIKLQEAKQKVETQGAEMTSLAENLTLARDQAQHSSSAKSIFLANMSHELRTPLNTILGFSEIMTTHLFGPLGDSHYEEYAKDIHTSGEHLLGLIDDILDLSKVEAGKLQLTEEAIDIDDTISACLDLVKVRAAEGKVELSYEVAEGLSVLYADGRLLKQMLLNLLSNAVKFTPEKGRIKVGAGLGDDGGLVLTVADTGIGIAEADIVKVMTPFDQVDSPLAHKNKGTGLGVPLTKELVEMHGGTMFFDSKVGVGTTVTIHFPAERVARK